MQFTIALRRLNSASVCPVTDHFTINCYSTDYYSQVSIPVILIRILAFMLHSNIYEKLWLFPHRVYMDYANLYKPFTLNNKLG